MDDRMKSLFEKVEQTCIRLDIPVTNDLVLFFSELWDRGYLTNQEALQVLQIFEKNDTSNKEMTSMHKDKITVTAILKVFNAIALVGLDNFSDKDGSIDLSKVVDCLVEKEHVTQKDADVFGTFILELLKN